jgi:hypothetical protein
MPGFVENYFVGKGDTYLWYLNGDGTNVLFVIVAVNKIPNFLADPNTGDNTVMPHHRCTIHINCEDTNCITEAYLDAKQGRYSKR